MAGCSSPASLMSDAELRAAFRQAVERVQQAPGVPRGTCCMLCTWHMSCRKASGLVLGQKVDGADRPCAAGPAESEEEGGSVPLVEVHRTPSTGSWLGMVRRRIVGGASEDGEGSGGMVREFSLPKQRRSGQGGTLKARHRQLPPQLPSSLLSPRPSQHACHAVVGLHAYWAVGS